MNIIFGKEKADALKNKYTVLPVDTLKIMPMNVNVQAYCVVENIPITELSQIDSKKDLHNNLILNYQKKNWNYCEQALEHLFGCWGGELDSFYTDLKSRIDKYKEQDPGELWDGTIERFASVNNS